MHALMAQCAMLLDPYRSIARKLPPLNEEIDDPALASQSLGATAHYLKTYCGI